MLIFNTEKEHKEGFIDIIDGQQRLLTITVFLAAPRDLAKDINSDEADLIQRQDIGIEGFRGNMSYRIDPSDTLKGYFLKYIQQDTDDIRGSSPHSSEEKKVKENYEYLFERAKSAIEKSERNDDKRQLIQDLRAKVRSLIVISVEISREEDAYEIFESTNARGVDLSVGDLLKNLIFKNIAGGTKGDTAKEKWQDITADVEATDTELKKFIRYHWISRQPFVTEKRIFREIKSKISDWTQLLNDLHEDAKLYNQLFEGSSDDYGNLKHGDKIYDAVCGLRVMRVSQCFVLLMAILRNRDRIGTDPTEVFEFIEKFMFQYSVVCKLPGNKLERVYSKYALHLQKIVQGISEKYVPGQVQRLFSELKKDLLKEAPSKVMFSESFTDLSYRNSEQGRHLIRYVLTKINAHFERTGESRPYFGTVNIEHVLPLNPGKGWGLAKKGIRVYVNLLGNLTLLHKGINSKIQNDTIDQKLEGLKESTLSINRDLEKWIYDHDRKWGEKEIRDRQSYFAGLAYDCVWHLGE